MKQLMTTTIRGGTKRHLDPPGRQRVAQAVHEFSEYLLRSNEKWLSMDYHDIVVISLLFILSFFQLFVGNKNTFLYN